MMSEKTVLIIGASRGIGLGLVEQSLAEGWQVTATYRGEAPAVSGVTWCALDITDATSQQRFITAVAQQRFSTILINAGIYGPEAQRLDQATDQQLNTLFLTNTFAPVRLAERLLPLLEPQTGVLGFTSSQMASLAENPDAQMPLYSASKAALNMLVRSLLPAAEQQGATLLSLHPGWVQTDMGGSQAPVTVAQSSQGLLTVLAAATGKQGHHYLDYQGHPLQW